ncbi:S-adenosyl-L-methionine-dependent methyltransferase [Xylariomycetidae sp. FL2044]|nr:S-adenosyl-L-methionine-dependent methyltransferase [Xylariomycetidae sp. FL2044]
MGGRPTGQEPEVAEAAEAAEATEATAATGPSAAAAPVAHVEQWEREAEDDTRNDDADSAVGSDVVSSTASLSTSILNYRTISGRRYHAERSNNTQYWASNDDTQNEALDIIHYLLTVCLDGRLYLAPLEKEKVHKVLDVGTGTGIWAIDFADEFPDAEITGTDISPIQPGWVPPNLKFEIDDFAEPWTFGRDVFDFVHMRYLYGSVQDWQALFREAYAACKPGGWVQSFEADAMIYSDDGTIADTSAMAQWGRLFNEGARKMGRVFTPLDDDLQEASMTAAGFVNMEVVRQKVPIGPWAAEKKWEEVGAISQTSLSSDLEGYVAYMAKLVGWTTEEVHVYCAQLRRELRSKKYHPYYHQRIVYAQKPLSSA